MTTCNFQRYKRHCSFCFGFCQITHPGVSQLPCHEDTQAALRRDPCGKELRPLTYSHVSESSQKSKDLILFIFGCVGSSLLHRVSLVVSSRGYSSLWCVGFSLRWFLLLWSMGSRCMGSSSCVMQAQQLLLAGSRAQAQQLWHTGLVALWHVGSSQTRD